MNVLASHNLDNSIIIHYGKIFLLDFIVSLTLASKQTMKSLTLSRQFPENLHHKPATTDKVSWDNHALVCQSGIVILREMIQWYYATL